MISGEASLVERVVIGQPIFFANHRRRIAIFHEFKIHQQASHAPITIHERVNFHEPGVQLRCALDNVLGRGLLVPLDHFLHFVVDMEEVRRGRACARDDDVLAPIAPCFFLIDALLD